MQPILDSGHNVLVLPADKYGYFRLPKERVPVVLPTQIVNVADPADSTSGSIGALPASGQPLSKRLEIQTLDLEPNDLCQLRVLPLDPRVRFEIDQPAANSKFQNQGTGNLYWEKAGTNMLVGEHLHSLVPEMFVMGNQNRITLVAYNMDPDESIDLARCAFMGYKYQLEPLDDEQVDAFKKAGEPYTTLSVGVVKN
jgi:hypothetical protein